MIYSFMICTVYKQEINNKIRITRLSFFAFFSFFCLKTMALFLHHSLYGCPLQATIHYQVHHLFNIFEESCSWLFSCLFITSLVLKYYKLVMTHHETISHQTDSLGFPITKQFCFFNDF